MQILLKTFVAQQKLFELQISKDLVRTGIVCTSMNVLGRIKERDEALYDNRITCYVMYGNNQQHHEIIKNCSGLSISIKPDGGILSFRLSIFQHEYEEEQRQKLR